ncbi:hypothetical protein TNCV_4383241 [Trichonephila clavipes]|nr:hypothetical protein TNCV_4383241 [Trichonephila clavipes]
MRVLPIDPVILNHGQVSRKTPELWHPPLLTSIPQKQASRDPLVVWRCEGENSGGGQGPLTSLPLPPTTRKDLRLDGYLEYPHTGIIDLQTSMSSSGFEPSPCGTAVSVANNYTVWATPNYCITLTRGLWHSTRRVFSGIKRGASNPRAPNSFFQRF